MTVMTLNAQRLDAEIGDLVAIEGQYDVVSDNRGGGATRGASTHCSLKGRVVPDQIRSRG